MFRVRKKFKFEAAHRLKSSYTEPCQRFHGHSYVVEVFICSSKLNEDGMVIDFGKLKDLMEDILKEFDHRILLDTTDVTVGAFVELEKATQQDFGLQILPTPPTAEFFAKHIFDRLSRKVKNVALSNNPYLEWVRVHETETGWAEYNGEIE